MFNHYYKAASIVLLGMLSVTSQADDLDIYAGGTSPATTTPELIFAIDTSESMSCALGQNIDNTEDVPKCYFNTHEEELAIEVPTYLTTLGIPDYEVPETVKIELIRSVMAEVLGIAGQDGAEEGEDGESEEQVLPDNVKVGLAFYNFPGGAIVQPLKPLGQATGLVSPYDSHRKLIYEELKNVVPIGRTPIMGTLLEIGQYLTGGEVINGKVRAPEQAKIDSLDSKGWGSSAGLQVLPTTETYGEASRTSHQETVTTDTLAYSVSTDCQTAINNNVVTGKGNIACASERLGLDDVSVFYNEDINSATACEGNVELESRTTATQVVLLSDGLPDGEDLSFDYPVGGTTMATWVHRFVTGNPSAIGSLSQGAFDQTAEDFPDGADFEDLGCPETARSIYSDDNDSDEELQRRQYESCLYNVAHRFRELGVKVNVIGFALEDQISVNNNVLRKIAVITGGDFRATSNVGDLTSFINSLATGTIASSILNVPLSPSVGINPGSILTNSGDVYVPSFKSSDTSFYYGNLKKYKLEVTDQGAVLKGDNDSVATEECQIGDDANEVYTCFRSGVRDLWTSARAPNENTNYAAVTVGGAAEQQDVYGPAPNGGRKVFIQNGKSAHDLRPLNLISVGANPEYGTPDGDALNFNDDAVNIDIATKNYYAQLVENPGSPGNTFNNFADLQTAVDAGATDLLADVFAHDVIRWLNGFDQKRFNDEGGYSSIGEKSERDLLGANVPLADGADLEKSRQYYGAIVHNTPTLVNYGFDTSGDTLVYDNTIFLSGNDGFLRAVDADDGTEHFSFFPEALIPNLSAWYQNSPGKMVYGLDSTWTAWRQDLPDDTGVFDGQIEDSNGFVRLYGGMRRGGYSYYFLDVSDRNQPVLLREIQRGDEGFENLGQTWSQPVLARIKKPGESLPTVVAVFGGGYDPDYDEPAPVNANPDCVDTDDEDKICGNQIYMVEAGGYTGESSDVTGIGDIVWWASNDGPSVDFRPGATMYSAVDNMNHSIPSKVKIIDIDDDGYTDRIYVGDLGGQVFRIKINNHIASAESPEAQFITIDTLAQVGHEGFDLQNDANKRMFFEAPSVAVMKNNNQRYIGVAIASGWRSKPSDKNIEDELYFFRDDLAGNEEVLRRPAGDEVDEDDPGDFIVGVQEFAGTAAELDAAKALAASLNSEDGDSGVKAFGSPVILRSNVFLPIYIPPTDTELQTSLTECEPPPHRSALVGFKVQSDADVSFVSNNDGNIIVGSSEGNIASHFRSSGVRSVPFNGLGVHVGNDTVSILAGTESITLSLPDERVRKTRWELLESGQDLVDQLENPVSGPE